MTAENKGLTLPELSWKKATCTVCGDDFDYLSSRRPPTCRKGECKYKYEYKIDRGKWAVHQFSLFE